MIKTTPQNSNNENILSKFANNVLTGTHLDIFGGYETELHMAKLFIHKYNQLCHTYSVYASIDLALFIKKLKNTYRLTNDNFILKEEHASSKNLNKIDYNSSTYLIEMKDCFILEVSSYKAEFYYGKDIDFKDITDIISIIKIAKKKKKHRQRFYMVSTTSRSETGFEFKRFELKKINLDFATNYNDNFLEVHKIIYDFLKTSNNNGLVLLHGKYGTGKTTYIRYLMSKINKRFIFLPLNLMDAMSSPNFIPFISKFKDSIFILEDCEDLLKPRSLGNTSNNSLVNLLNLGDGLLSDAFAFKIICTFNANIRQIDQAILRKGRLIARYEFAELELPKVKVLWNKLKIEGQPTKPMVLSDIYNKNSKDYNDVEIKKVGFNL